MAIPNHEPKPRRDVLALDFDTIAAINAKLLRLTDSGVALDDVHGTLKLKIVHGQFQELKVAQSYRFPQERKRRLEHK